jgi:peptidoglycan/xylan/chitin deacetylase (PgdA/CDA1 family)
MRTRVLITIDTEFLWRPDTLAEGWEASFERGYDPARVGVPYQLELLARHGLKACFFVDPMPACLFGLEPIRRMVEPILAAGQEVQLHLHPQWAGADAEGAKKIFELASMKEDEQRAMIARARDLLIEAGAPPPVAFRAGSYAANDATLRALASLGIRYDSSHNGGHHPWPSAVSLRGRQIAPLLHQGVIEVPVSQIWDRTRLRNLQICAVSSSELEAALDHALAKKHAIVTIVSHSFELAARNGLYANITHLRRFERLCALLGERQDELPTAFFTELADLPLGQPDRPLPHHPVRTVARQASQLWSNFVHERRA